VVKWVHSSTCSALASGMPEVCACWPLGAGVHPGWVDTAGCLLYPLLHSLVVLFCRVHPANSMLQAHTALALKLS
jgi:hypothetical protein